MKWTSSELCTFVMPIFSQCLNLVVFHLDLLVQPALSFISPETTCSLQWVSVSSFWVFLWSFINFLNFTGLNTWQLVNFTNSWPFPSHSTPIPPYLDHSLFTPSSKQLPIMAKATAIGHLSEPGDGLLHLVCSSTVHLHLEEPTRIHILYVMVQPIRGQHLITRQEWMWGVCL